MADGPEEIRQQFSPVRILLPFSPSLPYFGLKWRYNPEFWHLSPPRFSLLLFVALFFYSLWERFLYKNETEWCYLTQWLKGGEGKCFYYCLCAIITSTKYCSWLAEEFSIDSSKDQDFHQEKRFQPPIRKRREFDQDSYPAVFFLACIAKTAQLENEALFVTVFIW